MRIWSNASVRLACFGLLQSVKCLRMVHGPHGNRALVLLAYMWKIWHTLLVEGMCVKPVYCSVHNSLSWLFCTDMYENFHFLLFIAVINCVLWRILTCPKIECLENFVSGIIFTIEKFWFFLVAIYWKELQFFQFFFSLFEFFREEKYSFLLLFFLKAYS